MKEDQRFDRIAGMIEDRLAGMTYEEIGNKYGISRQRVGQIYGKYNTSPKDKLVFDLTYINQYSVWLDIKLIFRTLLVLLTPDSSTEAFEKPKNTNGKEK